MPAKKSQQTSSNNGVGNIEGSAAETVNSGGDEPKEQRTPKQQSNGVK